ncbi:hypothetical protein [Pelomonas sp. KK5]|uniref:hypothetical protein n=1 Tax=Pelomonas sp. KK5 TaxID=1855730 RepID=UPI00097C3C9F|nr:hypothetical protein [Pelomonas sp. KK5]
MLSDLSLEQQELAGYMSELSEDAYCAGWIDRLEFSLWQALSDGPRKFGQLDLATEHLARLAELSEASGGWIYYNGENDESFASFSEWQRLVANTGGLE